MYSVMIVEDEVLVSVGLQNMVHWADMEMTIVGCAQNGRQGLEMYYQKKPDIILTDLKMPVMDGIEMIRQIRKSDTTTKIIVLTSYEEYELIRQAFKLGISDYILKLKMLPEDIENVIQKIYQELKEGEEKRESGPKEILMPKRTQMIEKCRNYMLHSLDRKEFEEAASDLEMTDKGLVVLEMEVTLYQKEQSIKTQPIKEVQQMTVNLVQELLDEKNSGIVFWKEEDRYLLVLVFSRSSEREERKEITQKILSRIQSMLQTYRNRSAIFGVSSFGKSFELVKQLYEEAVSARKEAVFLDMPIVLYGMGETYDIYASMLTDFEGQLKEMESFSDNCRIKILKEVDFLKRMLEVPGADDMREAFGRWIHRISFDDIQHKEELLKITLDAVAQIRMTDCLSNMIQIFENYVQDIKDAKECRMVSPEVSQAILFISEHYAEDSVSLSRIAHMVGMNKDYFSSLFKKETGYGLADYVNHLRIRKAKELLAGTNKKAYEVGLEVGFQDESYFSRVFKKIVGVRPNEYKKKELNL